MNAKDRAQCGVNSRKEREDKKRRESHDCNKSNRLDQSCYPNFNAVRIWPGMDQDIDQHRSGQLIGTRPIRLFMICPNDKSMSI